jgi:hypothetical protein
VNPNDRRGVQPCVTTDGEQLGNSTTLPGDLTSCHAMIEQLLEALQGATRKIGTMEHRLEQLLRRLYGRSSEKELKRHLRFSDIWRVKENRG